MRPPEEGARVDGGLLCPLHLQGETGPARGGVGLLWLSLRQNSDGCWNGEGPLTPINFCESGFLCDELEMLHGLLSSCQWIS